MCLTVCVYVYVCELACERVSERERQRKKVCMTVILFWKTAGLCFHLKAARKFFEERQKK